MSEAAELMVLEPVRALVPMRSGSSDVESQLDAAHRYPRSLKTFMARALSMATLSVEVAESCIYAVPRGGKTISGPSIRLAEIVASSWGNLHVGSRIVDEEERNVVVEGAAWDLEANLKMVTQVKRRITYADGGRFNDDMITMTGNAAASIARRNAIFGVIPRCFVSDLFTKIRKVAVGDAKTLTERRGTVIERLNKMGATTDRILAALGKKGIEDIGLDELELLIGFGTAIKEGDRKIDDVFPAVLKDAPPSAIAPVAEQDQGRKMALGTRKAKEAAKAAAPPPSDGGAGDELPDWGKAPTTAEIKASQEREAGED